MSSVKPRLTFTRQPPNVLFVTVGLSGEPATNCDTANHSCSGTMMSRSLSALIPFVAVDPTIQMSEIAERLKIAVDFDHDGLMTEIKAAIQKSTRQTSAQSLDRGARIVSLAERRTERFDGLWQVLPGGFSSNMQKFNLVLDNSGFRRPY